MSKQIKTTETVFDIIETIRDLDEPTVSTITGNLDYTASTIHGHLATLEDRGYVTRNDDGSYQLALRFLDLGSRARQEVEGFGHVKPRLDRLVEQTEERAQFMTLENGQGVYLYMTESQRAAPSHTYIGKFRHLNTCASGKSILAALPRSRVEEIIDTHGFKQRTENTITDTDRLYEELDQIQDRGYAINREESVKGLVAIGAAIHETNGDVLGAISISAPAHRMTDERIESEISNALLGTIEEIELNSVFS